MKNEYTKQDMQIALLESSNDNLKGTLNRIESDIRSMNDTIHKKLDEQTITINKIDSRLWYIAFFIIASYSSALIYLLKEGIK